MRDKLRNIFLIIFVISIMLCIVSISYGYFKPVVDNIEDRSTIKLDGAEIYANYSSTSTIYVDDIEPSDGVIGYKDFSLEVKNTSSRDVSAYIYLDIIYSDYTDIENDGVLYYELVSDGTTIVDKTMIKAISSGKALLYELVIPSHTNSTTINYRLNIYFPLSDKIQNLNKGEDGTMKFNGKIEVTDNIKLIDYLSYIDMDSNSLEYDDYKNLRYVGSTPNNYIIFNDETWRIIGIVDGYLKIISDDSIGTYQWNNIADNDWTTASLQIYLNGTYYNNLTATAKEQIEERTWNLGGWSRNDVSVADMYTYERGEEVFTGRPTTWTGNIALMYPSDYGYASENISCRENIFKKNTDGYYGCKLENWLYKPYLSGNLTSADYYWLLSPFSLYKDYSCQIFYEGYISFTGYVTNFYSVRPTLHLTNETTRVSGTGTSFDPYIIG